MSEVDKTVASLAERRQQKTDEARQRGAPPQDDKRPIIRLSAGDLRTRVADEAEAALIASGMALYKQGGRIVRIVLDKIKTAGGGEGHALRLSTLVDASVLSAFEKHAIFEQWSSGAKGYITANCPKETAAAYLARDGAWKLPYLLGVISAPMIRPDGSILSAPGYDEKTGLVFDPRGYEFPTIAEEPSKFDAVAALAVLKHPLRSFPFSSPISQAVALSGIMTAVVRRALPTAPLHAFTAPTAGSGKSMLVDIAAIIATGERAAVTTSGNDGRSDAEIEKRLTASMLSGDAVLSLDNLEGALAGEMLCSLLTQPSAKLRPLGRSVNVDVPITTAFFATSNNLIVKGDMTRRVLAGALDPHTERPELRKFDFNPMKEAWENRGQLVVAVLTIIRAWMISGATPQKTPLGSFEEWSRMVREPLIWLGESDPVDIMEEVRKGDPRLIELKQVMEAWHDAFKDAPKTVAEVIGAASETTRNADGDSVHVRSDLHEAIKSVMRYGKSVSAEGLSWWLRKNAGRYLGEKRFERLDGYGEKYLRWRLNGSIGSISDGGSTGSISGLIDDEAPF